MIKLIIDGKEIIDGTIEIKTGEISPIPIPTPTPIPTPIPIPPTPSPIPSDSWVLSFPVFDLHKTMYSPTGTKWPDLERVFNRGQKITFRLNVQELSVRVTIMFFNSSTLVKIWKIDKVTGIIQFHTEKKWLDFTTDINDNDKYIYIFECENLGFNSKTRDWWQKIG